MKIISWNVNGFRAWVQKKDSFNFLKKEKPDIFCLQETKAQPEQISETIENSKLNKKIFDQYKYQYFNSAEKKGYSGTAVFAKQKPLSTEYGLSTLSKKERDLEGRAITLEFKNFFLVNVYTPNSKSGLERLKYRYDLWDKAFLKHLKKLEKKKPVVICGDLNVAHEEIDLKNPQANKTTKTKPGNAGFTNQERERFSDFLRAGFVDTFRFLYPKKIIYSWWSYRFNARKNNAGWRIDYFLISSLLKNKLKKAKVFDQTHGSDHCPVGIEIF